MSSGDGVGSVGVGSKIGGCGGVSAACGIGAVNACDGVASGASRRCADGVPEVGGV